MLQIFYFRICKKRIFTVSKEKVKISQTHSQTNFRSENTWNWVVESQCL